jgi:uncharacterized membrane protein
MTLTERLVDGSVVVDLVERVENETRLDSLISRVAPVVDRVIATPGARDLLQGRWLGHAIHPLLTDLPLGLWTGTNVLDLLPVPGSRRSAERLLALGLLSVPAVVVTGWAEWRDIEIREQRVGVVHAGLNASGVVLYGLSLMSRRRDRHGWGVALALGGSVMVAAAGYLGGHLTAVRKVSSVNPAFDTPSDDRE